MRVLAIAWVSFLIIVMAMITASGGVLDDLFRV